MVTEKRILGKTLLMFQGIFFILKEVRIVSERRVI